MDEAVEKTNNLHYQALLDHDKGDLALELGDKNRLLVYHGIQMAPLHLKIEPTHQYWTDVVDEMSQKEITQLVLDHNRENAQAIAGPAPGFQAHSFTPGDLFGVILPTNQIAVLQAEEITTNSNGILLDIYYLDPLLELVGMGFTARQAETIDSAFTANLPNGVTVELIGICEHPSEGKQWWRPDGTLLASAPYEKAYGYAEPNVENDYEFAVRFGGYPEKEIRYAVKAISGEIDGGALSSAWEGGNRIENILVRVANFNASQKIATLGLGVGAGSWQLVFESPPRESVTADLPGGQQVRVEMVKEKAPGLVEVEIVHTIHDAWWRVVALDQTGGVHVGRLPIESRASEGQWITLERTFNLPLSEIEKLRLEIRPYQWITFKNVSLNPGHKTSPIIEIKPPEPKPYGQ